MSEKKTRAFVDTVIHLDDGASVSFRWMSSGALNVQCWRPGTVNDRQTWLLAGSKVLGGAELADLLSVLASAQPEPELPTAA